MLQTQLERLATSSDASGYATNHVSHASSASGGWGGGGIAGIVTGVMRVSSLMHVPSLDTKFLKLKVDTEKDESDRSEGESLTQRREGGGGEESGGVERGEQQTVAGGMRERCCDWGGGAAESSRASASSPRPVASLSELSCRTFS